MERGSSKHSPQLDDELAKEARAYTQGAPGPSRVDEWRDPEVADDDQPEADRIPAGQRPSGAPEPLRGQDLAARSRLGRYIPLSSLPGDRRELLRGAEEMGVPPDLRAELDRLPDGQMYRTVYEIWEALGYSNEDPGRGGEQGT
ncbi:DUF2795 domain-containing protein [Natronosporangium hydrolyticum]|uniref:DUF2795 domain-containing protein n=1 Tax=Natronosporangium hydrolyticum TaxID=2811111 RepID=A0A895YNL1_9ACTN|nr:DUF2795 domain-containing protein [Natronosporangium hydrolyticum]QSB16883.1 DUF2795 domain-containing protein [Natronosporangium hydrolyticum]